MKRGWVNRLKEMTRSWASRIATSGRPGVASAARGQRFMAGGVKPYTPLQAAIDAVAKGSGRKFVGNLRGCCPPALLVPVPLSRPVFVDLW